MAHAIDAASSARRRSFESAAAPPLPVRDSEYLAYLEYCASAYGRMDRLCDRLSELDAVAARVQRSLELRARDTQECLETFRAMATVNRYDQRIYLSADGQRGYHENGNALTRREFELAKWNRRTVSWEEYNRTVSHLSATIADHQQVLAYRRRLAGHRAVTLRDEPLTDDALVAIEGDLDRMPDAVRRRCPRSLGLEYSAAREYLAEHGFRNAPAVREAFNNAAPPPEAASGRAGRRASRPVPPPAPCPDD